MMQMMMIMQKRQMITMLVGADNRWEFEKKVGNYSVGVGNIFKST